MSDREDAWFIQREGQRLGPYKLAAIKALAARGMLRTSDLLWTQGMLTWQSATDIPGVTMGNVAAPAEAPAAAASPAPPATSARAPLPSLEPEPGYLLRHWRGELSLPVSYWVNGAVATLVLVGLIALIGNSPFIAHQGAVGTGAWILCVLAATLALGLWQFTGVWRSAAHHVERGGSAGWARLAKVMVALGLLRMLVVNVEQFPLLRESLQLIAGHENIPKAELHVVNHGTEVEIAGGMSFGTAEQLRAVLAASPQIRRVQLNNGGGWINEGTAVGALITARGLDTYTARECDSACLLAFLSGRERFISQTARLGFHEASVAGVGGQIAEDGTQEFRKRLEAVGAPRSFIDRALGTPPSAVWYPTPQQLIDAHVITGIVDGRDFATTGVAGWRNPQQIAASFDDVPIMATIHKVEPKIYQQLQAQYVQGIQGGEPQTEIVAKIHAIIVAQVLPTYLRIAPDDELIAYWRSQLRELREYEASDPRYCVGALFPDSRLLSAKAQDALSADAKAEDLRSFGTLLEAAAAHPASVPAQAQIAPVLQVALQRVQQNAPDAVRLVVNPQKAFTQPLQLCQAELAFLDQIMGLPREDAGAVLRWIAAGGR